MALGCFFQYHRLDGFLHLFSMENTTSFSGMRILQGRLVAEKGKDAFLILYDSLDVASVLQRHNLTEMLDKQKKAYRVATIYDPVEVLPEYRGVLIASGRLQLVASLPAVCDYVANGGTAAVLQKINPGDAKEIPANYLFCLGIGAVAGEMDAYGIDLRTDFMLGGKGFSFGEGSTYHTNASQVSLLDDAKVHVRAMTGEPLVIEHPWGKGRFLSYNGVVRDDRTNIGLMAAFLSHCGEDAIYPVVGAKLFFLDGFPSPVPEGNFGKIYDELRVSTADFYRDIWWPYVLQLREDYGLKLTGLIIESYGNQVKGPFRPMEGRGARDNLIVYGRELLASGGELGLHGYNHQSLAPEGYHQTNRGDVPWESQKDMEESLRELRRYITEVYPDYEFRCYVPPSDILSPEGRAAVRKVFPELKVYSSIFDGPAEAKTYCQDYKRNGDGTYEIPRVSSGYVPKRQSMYEEISVLNYIGIFSHSIHPNEMSHEESKGLSWADMSGGIRDFLGEVDARYPWLEGMTDSECMEYLCDYLDMDYRVEREKGFLELHCVGFRKPVRFVLRTQKEIAFMDGGEFEKIDDHAYLIKVGQEMACVFWKDGVRDENLSAD
ncbi:MAG: DUF2194 domain-containing protein [Selenomonadaceae bacterium]|nr:DUF2194 domain-containing protein [Selenomonadaceae bacterium]